MYELIILSSLMRGPAHGYLMAKIINDVIGPFAKLSNGRFYPLLAKLEQGGFIADAPAQESDGPNGPERNARRFVITDAGRERFHRLMLDTTVTPGDHQRTFLFKVTSFDLIAPRERLHVIDHYLHYCEAHILYTGSEAESMECEAEEYNFPPAQMAAIRDAIDHLNRQWTLEAEWVRSLRARHAQAAAAEGAKGI